MQKHKAHHQSASLWNYTLSPGIIFVLIIRVDRTRGINFEASLDEIWYRKMEKNNKLTMFTR